MGIFDWFEAKKQEKKAKEYIRWLHRSTDGLDLTVNAIMEIGEPAVKPLTEALINAGDEFTRMYAAWILGRIGDERAVEPLIQALKDENAIERDRFKVLEAVEPLIQALKDEEECVQERAAWALGRIGDERAVEPLIQALKDTDWSVRESAAEALGRIGDERAVEPLIQALKDENKYVLEKAAEALKKIG